MIQETSKSRGYCYLLYCLTSSNQPLQHRKATSRYYHCNRVDAVSRYYTAAGSSRQLLWLLPFVALFLLQHLVVSSSYCCFLPASSSSFFVKAQSCDNTNYNNQQIGSSSHNQQQQQRPISSPSSTLLSSSSSSSVPSDNNNNAIMATSSSVLWFQHKITITAPKRGCHLITNDIMKVAGSDIGKVQIGMCNLFVQHTSASLTINENADPDVRVDMETALNKVIPASWNRDGTFRHTMEGDDDMPGHVKSSLMGVSVNIPISNGRLGLGTWQGIYLNEHRDQGGWGTGHSRSILITIQGQSK